MSIKKRICTLFITLALMLSMTSLPAFAASDDTYDVREYHLYAQRVIDNLLIVGEKKPYALYYYSHSYELAEELDDVAYDYEDGKATYIAVQNKYDEIKDFYENPWIRSSYAEITCNIAVHEKNYNNWYTEEQWNTFVEKRNNLLQALSVNHPNFEPERYGSVKEDDYTLAQQKYIDKCFFELIYIYNEMTCKDIVMGDVNRDGTVDVADVTLIQKYIAGEAEFTDAQKLRARVNDDSYSVSIKDVTTVQKCIVNYQDAYLYQGGIVRNESDFATSLDNWQICPQW
nr:dockerin type I domain-containing protein [uncultured Ruminococcus sp.]